ncbi:hypothetical protein QYE76_031151 [Lolium multiflorum]|uniref:Uncharacterized protein n=1 Tax=Lolium multiflorum TaxID=4521 RepID=A0AAD8QR36_LOLMU|nr:hypothetical protein QYE76_031151 [Lolium multiflorum]
MFATTLWLNNMEALAQDDGVCALAFVVPLKAEESEEDAYAIIGAWPWRRPWEAATYHAMAARSNANSPYRPHLQWAMD